MKLSKEQINQLYTFTRQHYVEWYDLQTELVDHLANDIESIWKKEPQLSFNQAKNKSFKKFGIFGFNDVIIEKRKALNKNYWLLVWKYFKEFFNLPKIILTILLFGITFTLFDLITNKEVLLSIFFGLIFLTLFGFLFYNHKKNKFIVKQSQKKWLFQENISNMGGLLTLICAPINMYYMIVTNIKWSQSNIIIISIILVTFGLLIYLLIIVIPSKIEETMAQHYPEYKLYRKA